MNITIKNVKKEVKNTRAPRSNDYHDSRIGFWGTVTEVNSRRNLVSIMSDTGILYTGIPVISNTWVNTDNNAEFVTGERYLPPVNARVFVLTPTYSAEGAFVLCSGFARGDTHTDDFFASNDSEMEEKNTKSLKVSQSGWIQTENYNTGNVQIKSQDKEIEVEINLTDNKQENIEKKVSIKAWGTSIVIKESGITFDTDKALDFHTSNNIALKSDGDITINAGDGTKNVDVKAKKFSVNSTDFTVGV